jgi:lipoprotein signal peptidase
MLDRLYFGCVIDFIKLPYWPYFNLADTFIAIGVILTVVQIRTTDSHWAHMMPPEKIKIK